MDEQFKNLNKIDSLDFRNNKRQLVTSYLLRILGVFVFALLFLIIAKYFKNSFNVSMNLLLNIKIESLPSIVSIFLVILDVLLVLYLHELIPATVFFISHKQKPQIGIHGFIIFAAAPDKILNKFQLIINALAPFTVITLIGLLLIFFTPLDYLSWIFIPTVVNAAAAGGDFMTAIWSAKKPKNTKFIDTGDITNAYTEM